VARLVQDSALHPATPGAAPLLLAATGLTVMGSGALLALFGLVRAGALVRYVPQPVLAGFMNGVAVLMVVSQVPVIAGVAADELARRGWSALAQWHWPALVATLTTAAVMWAVARRWPRLPAGLVALVLGTAAVWAMQVACGGWAAAGACALQGFGALSSALPRPEVAIAIVDAQIYTLEGHAFDVFLVRRESRGPVRIDTTPAPVDAALVERFQVDLQACLTGAIDAEALVRRGASTPSWMKRRSPAVATEVVVDNEASPRFTVVDVFTRDRSGVLYAIARTLHEQGLTIALSKVNTEGERVADVFYVQDASGGKVRDPERLGALRAALRERLDALHEGAS